MPKFEYPEKKPVYSALGPRRSKLNSKNRGASDSSGFKVLSVKKIVSENVDHEQTPDLENYTEIPVESFFDNKEPSLKRNATGPTLERNGQKWFDPDENYIVPFLAPIE